MSEVLDDVMANLNSDIEAAVACAEPVIDQVDVVTIVDGEVRGLELFDSVGMLASKLPSLWRGIAVNGELVATLCPPAVDDRVFVASVEWLLVRVADARLDAIAGIGLGETLVPTGEGLVGTGL